MSLLKTEGAAHHGIDDRAVGHVPLVTCSSISLVTCHWSRAVLFRWSRAIGHVLHMKMHASERRTVT
jgi:hypothetical protein